MYVITFYSFKGGVGRTMALVNVAAELVRRGRKVLVVDFDLEAPGLETYERLRPPKPHPGIVEFVTEYRRTNQTPNLLDYIYETKPIGTKGGRLWVMPAGRRDSAYHRALTDLDWQRLYKNEDGFLLFEDTKKGWEVDESLKADYVLIDSRTGDTDTLGICTRQLPDSVVLMFTPNEQNLAGLENVCRDIRREETEGLKKKIGLYFVAANVPDLDDEKRILYRQIQAFRKRLDFKDLSGTIRRYENLNLLNQSVFTLDRPHSRLARSYRRLLRTLLKDNFADREGAMIFLSDYSKRIESRDFGKKFFLTTYREGEDANTAASEEDKNCLHKIVRHFNENVEILTKVADSFMKEQAYKSARKVLDRVLQLEPNFGEPLFHRAICKLNLGLVDDAAADLLDCLRLPVSDPHFSALDKVSDGSRAIFKGAFHNTVLAMLHNIAPKRMFDVADMLETQGLLATFQEEASERAPFFLCDVVSFLCDSEEGVNRAIRLLRETKTISAVPDKILLRARCWKEVIQSREAGRFEEKGAGEVLPLALARWGEDGEMPESLCKQALEALEGDSLFVHHWGLQAIALLFWRTGKVTDAMECLDIAEQRAVVDTDQSFPELEKEDQLFSLWRLRDVSAPQYLDDCHLLRRMFRGEHLRPAFFGPASA
jgi:MinD-like ATPase involved in chromosome partitioning or flagellar assembly